MKTRAILTCSLILNVILLGIAASLWRAKTPGRTTTDTTSSPQTALAKTRVLQKTNTLVKSTTDVVTVDWRMVESENYKQYIANLRSIGCPEETIRDIIIADVNKLFESRGKQLFPATNKFEYWKGGNFFASLFDETKMQKQQALNAEKRALLKELLGVDVPDKGDIVSGTKTMETLLDFLPSEKQTKLMELEQQFAGKMGKYMKAIQAGDMSALKKLQAEKDAEMLKILSPEEKFEYDLRMSQTAMVMRMQMGDVDLSEQEFRDVFKLRKQFEDEYGLAAGTSSTAEEREKRAAAEKVLDGQVRQSMGDSRFLEMKYSATFERSSLNKIAQEYNIPRENALKVFDIRATAQEQAARVRDDRSLDNTIKQDKLNQIRSYTEIEIGKWIGPQATADYINKGSSIKNLNRLSVATTGD